jgi:hypothetical protein
VAGGTEPRGTAVPTAGRPSRGRAYDGTSWLPSRRSPSRAPSALRVPRSRSAGALAAVLPDDPLFDPPLLRPPLLLSPPPLRGTAYPPLPPESRRLPPSDSRVRLPPEYPPVEPPPDDWPPPPPDD